MFTKTTALTKLRSLKPLEPLAYRALKEGLEKKDYKYVQLYYNYYGGRIVTGKH